MNLDQFVFVVLQGALALVCVVAKAQERRGAKRRAGTHTGICATPTVLRGPNSMNFLYVSYGVATVVYALATQVAEAFCGYKAVFIVLDYLAFTYLFFFNSWFRNKLFVVQQRISKD